MAVSFTILQRIIEDRSLHTDERLRQELLKHFHSEYLYILNQTGTFTQEDLETLEDGSAEHITQSNYLHITQKYRLLQHVSLALHAFLMQIGLTKLRKISALRRALMKLRASLWAARKRKRKQAAQAVEQLIKTFDDAHQKAQVESCTTKKNTSEQLHKTAQPPFLPLLKTRFQQPIHFGALACHPAVLEAPTRHLRNLNFQK